MGQQVATECQCNGGVFQLCVPEAPTYEQQNEINGAAARYPGVYPQGVPSQQDLYLAMPSPNDDVVHMEVPVPEMHSQAAAAIQQDYTSVTGLAPPSPGRSPVQKDARRSWCQRITREDILTNLEDSEEMVYGEAFSMLFGGQNGYVALDSAAMREFISSNSVISKDDIDFEMLKIASPDEGLSRDAFLMLLREFTIVEADSISQFLNLSANSEDMSSEECRTGLLMFGQGNIASNMSQKEWESVLDTVMSDAGVVVKMDQWITYCKLMSRTVRLSRYAEKNATRSSHYTNVGVMGGA
jgi:hypothetical protein